MDCDLNSRWKGAYVTSDDYSIVHANEYRANESWDYSSLSYRYISCIKCGGDISWQFCYTAKGRHDHHTAKGRHDHHTAKGRHDHHTATVPSTHKFTLARERLACKRLAITRTRMDTNLGIPIREGRATPN